MKNENYLTDRKKLINAMENALSHKRKPVPLREVKDRICATNKRYENLDERDIETLFSGESGFPDSLFIKVGEGYLVRRQVEERLKIRVRREAATFGFHIFHKNVSRTELDSKQSIRKFHEPARAQKLEQQINFLKEHENELLDYFASGRDVKPNEIWPKIEVVESGHLSGDLFRYTSLLWSVPVSNGFGRRIRFLVWDEYSEKLIGIFAIGDPVFNLTCRDNWIGWNYLQRENRLYNVMDIFVLGAAPPFNELLGGKLVAMISTTDKVQQIVKTKYKESTTIISGIRKDPTLVLLTTGSALGRSALYDRITFDGQKLFVRIGESKGWGHFHLNNGLFALLKNYIDGTVPGKSSNRFGNGPNWKIRTMRTALTQLNIPSDLLRHGVKREIYGIPLAYNFSEFLRGENDDIRFKELYFDSLVSYWKDRWLKGRIERKRDFVNFNRNKIPELIRGKQEVDSKE